MSLQGRRHEAGCRETLHTCFECGIWCSSPRNLQQHMSGHTHRVRLEWLGRSVTPGEPCNDTPMRPASPAASSGGRAMSPDLPAAATAAPAAHAQPPPPPQPPTLDAVLQESEPPVGALLRCKLCNWTGSKAAAWHHFKVCCAWAWTWPET